MMSSFLKHFCSPGLWNTPHSWFSSYFNDLSPVFFCWSLLLFLLRKMHFLEVRQSRTSTEVTSSLLIFKWMFNVCPWMYACHLKLNKCTLNSCSVLGFFPKPTHPSHPSVFSRSVASNFILPVTFETADKSQGFTFEVYPDSHLLSYCYSVSRHHQLLPGLLPYFTNWPHGLHPTQPHFLPSSICHTVVKMIL